jgi:UDP-glucose 4-epimerase
VVGDVGDATLVRGVLERYRVTAVVHLAASIIAPDSLRRPLAYYRNNTAASFVLLEACAEHGTAAFVFSSTAAVYGNPPASPVDETAPTSPINPYGASKLMVERALADVGRATGFPYLALRYFNVAGADPDLRAGQAPGGASHLIRVACDTALGRRDRIPVYGTDYPTRDGTCVRDFVHVSDLAAAHVAALDHLLAGRPSAVLNCGYGRGFSVREVIAAVERASGRRLRVELAPRRAGDATEVVADNRRLRELLAWRPHLADLDLIVRHALAWERQLLPAAA